MARQARNRRWKAAALLPMAAAASVASSSCVRDLASQSLVQPAAASVQLTAESDSRPSSLLSALLNRSANGPEEDGSADNAADQDVKDAPEFPTPSDRFRSAEFRRTAAPVSTAELARERDTSRSGSAGRIRPLNDSRSSTPTGNQQSDGISWQDALTARCRVRLQHAEELAARGAVYSARQELIEVLRTVANACDAEQQTNEHALALSAALWALDEADDFVSADSSDGAASNVAAIAARHRTEVLHGPAANSVTAVEAVQLYCNAAIRDFILAAGDQPIASEALHALGRITELQHALKLGIGTEGATLAEQQMLVFYQAAALVDPSNYRATNELGVLLVRFGQLDRARAALEQSVSACRQPENCRNLAAVYESLGDHAASRRLRDQVQTATVDQAGQTAVRPESDTRGLAPVVYWVDPASMAAQSHPHIGTTADSSQPRSAAAAPSTAEPETHQRPGLTGKVKRWTSTLFGRTSHVESPH